MPPCTDGRLLAWVELSPRTLDLNLDQRKISSGHALEAEISSPEYYCNFSLMFLNIQGVSVNPATLPDLFSWFSKPSPNY